MKQILEQYGIEFKALSKYNTTCPECEAHRTKRHKANQKCLSVFGEEKCVVWQCNNSSCNWAVRQVHYFNQKVRSDMVDTIKVVEQQFKPWNSNGIWDGDIKELFDSAVKYPYYNSDEQLIFYILRIGDKDEKKIRPIALGADNKYVLSRPSGIAMPYRMEFFDPSKPTLIVEGEKSAEYAAKISKKSNVLSWVGGSNAVLKTDWSILKGSAVTLWEDNDEAGKKAMDELVNHLATDIIPSQLFRIDVSSLPKAYDIADIADMELIKKLFESRVEIDLDVSSKHQFTADRLFEEFQKKDDYIPFGYSEIDKYVQIPEPGLTVFTARTNHGKTNAMINVAANILKSGTHTVIYVSYEESGKKVGKRFLKVLDPDNRGLNHIEYDTMLTEGYIKGNVPFIETFKQYIISNKLRLYDVNTPLKDIVSTLNRLKALGKPTICILDYAQRLPSINNQQRYLALKEQMEELVNLANTNGQAIVTAAQVTAGENNYADVARESKDIENSADVIIGVWNKASGDARGAKAFEDVEGDVVWSVKKARQDKANGKKFGFTTNNGCDLRQVVVQLNNQEY